MHVKLVSVSEKWYFSLHVDIGVWIDLGAGAPVIDLPRSRDSASSECLTGSGNWAIINQVFSS